MKKDKTKIILGALLFLFFAVLLLHPLNAINQDLGRYFKVSETILETKSISKNNLFSYTEPEVEFINTHWLGGMTLFGLEKTVGLKGLILFKILIILLSFGLIFWMALKMSYFENRKNFYLVFFFSFVCLMLMLERTDVRPEIFSFLFFAIYYYILRTYKKGGKKIYFLPLIQLLWVNTHVYFFLGPVLWVAFLIGRWWQEKKYLELKKILSVGMVTALVIFINPNTWKGAFYPFQFLKEYGYSIVENQTPIFLIAYNYHLEIIAVYFILSFLLILGFYINRKNFKYFDLFFSVFLIYFGYFAIRNFPIFSMGVLPILAFNYSEIFKKFTEWVDSFEIKELKLGKFFLMGFVVLLIIFNLNKIDLNTKPKAKDAVDFLIENNIQGNIFNNYDVGGYLIYRLYPERKIFVDNRPEAYSVSFLQDTYIAILENPELWGKKILEYDINIIFFEITDGTPWAKTFLRRIVKDKQWIPIYLDNTQIILIKNIEKNQELINSYSLII